MKNYKAMIAEWVRVEVEKWFKSQCLNPTIPQYLWYKESSPGNNGELSISHEKPSKEWKLAHKDRISIAWTVDQAVYILSMQWCTNLPILDPND